jgi:putative phage-type endonuclease
MKVYELEQGTPEWLEAKAGKFTSSKFSDLFMAKTTKGWNSLINQVVFERLTGTTPESFSSDWMKRGTELEPQAREAYELATFNKVRQVGFVEKDEWVGCSPDGLIGSDGMVEIKCPKFSTLIDYHLTGRIPEDYYWQMQGGMYVCGRKWCDFYVWHPNLKPLLKRIEPVEADIKILEFKLAEAIAEAKKRISKIGGTGEKY